VREKYLEGDNASDDVLCQGLWTAKLGDLERGMSANRTTLDRWREERFTSGCALIISSRLVLCGSSVYVQKKSRYFVSMASRSTASAAADAPFPFAGALPLAFPLRLDFSLLDVVRAATVAEGAMVMCRRFCKQQRPWSYVGQSAALGGDHLEQLTSSSHGGGGQRKPRGSLSTFGGADPA